MELDGQLALVTGGAAGIGAAIARRLAEVGADVAIVDISSTADEAIAKLLVQPGQRVKSWQCDVTKPAEVSSTYDTIRRELGDPTILRGPRIIATDRQAPRIYPRMIRLCSRFDSVLFTPKMPAIPSYGNYSRSP
jgi:NAD(P)-dependent dehydrogenase (short-subunit alcohol dehydrogenase family)